MAIAENWQQDFILIEEIVNNKQVIKSFNFCELQRVEAKGKTGTAGVKREFDLIFKDGSNYVIPDDSRIISAPMDYQNLINRMALELKV